MSLGRVAKQLKRDFRANRKKAAMLGLLVAVAGWFWFPLVFKSKGAQPAPSTPVASTAGAPKPVVPAVGDAHPSWEEISHWMTDDRQMQPFVTVGGELRNPFESRMIDKVAEVETPPPPEPAPDLDPEALGLDLTSTAVSRSKRIASISGKIYEEGDEIPTISGVPFKLEKVGPSEVVLSMNGKRYTLHLKRVAHSDQGDGPTRQ